MKPNNENNFLIEVTPKTMQEINIRLTDNNKDPIYELHYSPYWKD